MSKHLIAIVLVLSALVSSPTLAVAATSRLGESQGSLYVNRITTSTPTRDTTLTVTNRRMRFNRNLPPAGLPVSPFGTLDIFVGTGSTVFGKQTLGFAEFREITDPTNVAYNAVEATDPIGAHFYFQSEDTNSKLFLKVRDSASWAQPTNNLFVFGSNGSMIAAANSDSLSPDPTVKLWVQGDNSIRLSGAVDGPTGGRVWLRGSGGYTTFTVEQSGDSQQKWLVWKLINGGTERTIKFLVQDLSLAVPYTAIGSSQVVKTFIIDHPLDHARYLMHAGIEGPENRVFYRGKVTLKHGEAFVALPDYFEGLTHDHGRVVFLQNMSDFDKIAVKTQDGRRIKNGVLHIVSQNKHSEALVSWEVSAIRKDVPELIVAPRIDEVEVMGIGPYRYVIPRE